MLSGICLLYSVSIYFVGSGTFSFVIWLVGALFFGTLFWLSGQDRWKKIPVPVRRIAYACIAVVMVVFILCMSAMISHFNDNGANDLDYIVVLGAQMRNSGPSIIFKYRLDAAYEYLLQNPDTMCIVSGAKGANELVSEGEGGKEYLISKGIDENRIIAETNAVDTVQNIVNSLDIIGNSKDVKIGVVTNNFHVFRGVHIAKKLTDSEVYGIAAYTVPWYLPNNMVRECFGILRDIKKLGM
ncbi:Uncharacterized SAM-binding protein YcdF, DUF218 family [Butyrivibrio sp. YAB3001]|nr:Uncharacterized SAM-binding protein YcdF, DUF218 family [Butyrivibrio sp. YAB3001]